jgi:hypothetical protein
MRNYAMSFSKLADCSRGLGDGCVSEDEDDIQYLLQALRELVARLTAPEIEETEIGVEEGTESTSATARAAELDEIERWEGDEYVYFEAALPDCSEGEIDVSIQGGRAFIRMART